MVRTRLGPGADEAFCLACHTTTGGNPLLLRQLLTALEAERVEPDEAHADVVRAIGSRAIAASVVRRLSRLPAGAGALGRAVAVLGDGAELAPAAALAELAEPDAAAAAALLSRAEILRAETPLAFVHPLVRDAVYRDIPPGERELAHERAARLLRDAAAPADQIAGHLLLAPRRGEPWVAETLLRTAARRCAAARRIRAVAHLRRALAEPPPDEARARGACSSSASRRCSRASRCGPTASRRPTRRSRTPRRGWSPRTRSRARTCSPAIPTRAWRSCGGRSPTCRPTPRTPGWRWTPCGCARSGSGPRTPSRSRSWCPWRERELTTLGEKMMGASAALEAGYRGAPADVVAGCALRALAGGELIAADNGLLSNSAIPPLAFADREEVMDAWDEALADAHRRGSPYSISGIHIWRGYTHFLRGELVDACADLEEAVQECRRFGYSGNVMAYAGSFLARALTERGELARAREILALVPHGSLNERVEGHRHFRNARLELLVAEGRPASEIEAAAHDARRRIEGWVNPIGHRWRSLLALALLSNGAREEAVGLVSAELEDARGVGAPGTLGRSLRALCEVTGDVEPLREAVDVLEGSPARLELAKALCALGAAAGDAEPLRRALQPRPRQRRATRSPPAPAPRSAASAPARAARRRRPDGDRAPRARALPRRRGRARDRRGALPRAVRGRAAPRLRARPSSGNGNGAG